MSNYTQEILQFLDETGSTWCPLDQISPFNVENALRSGELCYRNVKGRGFVTFPYFYKQEKRVARKIVDRINPIKVDDAKVYEYIAKVSPNPISRMRLDKNKAERHIRGGQATKNKYLKMKS